MKKPNRSEKSVESRRRYAREYVRGHREDRVAYNVEWSAKNPDKVSGYRKKLRAKIAQQFASGERTRATEGRCSSCKRTKPASDFYLSNTNPTGLHGWCKECSNRRTVERGRERMCGASPEDVARIFDTQGGRCAICKADLRRGFALDHDHVTGVARGVLCTRCNTLLGAARDNIALLWRAIIYLRGGKNENERSSKEALVVHA